MPFLLTPTIRFMANLGSYCFWRLKCPLLLSHVVTLTAKSHSSHRQIRGFYIFFEFACPSIDSCIRHANPRMRAFHVANGGLNMQIIVVFLIRVSALNVHHLSSHGHKAESCGGGSLLLGTHYLLHGCFDGRARVGFENQHLQSV